MSIDENVLRIMLEKAKNVAKNNNCVNDSNFSVASCLLTSNGKIYTGHNIENFGIQSTCSERTVFSKALSEGEKEFVAILVIGYPKKEDKFVDAWPCGYCREFMSSFVGDKFEVYSIDENQNFVFEYLKDLKPLGNFIRNKNYNLKSNSKIEIIEDVGVKLIDLEEKYKLDEMESIIEEAKLCSKNTNGYIQNEGAVLIGYNEKNEKVVFTGATQTDNNGTILRASKVALLKALSNGCNKFEKIFCISYDGKNIQKLWPSYDVIQLFLQYTSKDFKFITINDDNSYLEYTVQEVLPHPFKFEN